MKAKTMTKRDVLTASTCINQIKPSMLPAQQRRVFIHNQARLNKKANAIQDDIQNIMRLYQLERPAADAKESEKKAWREEQEIMNDVVTAEYEQPVSLHYDLLPGEAFDRLEETLPHTAHLSGLLFMFEGMDVEEDEGKREWAKEGESV
jgi:hypothetical protein